MFEGYSVDFGKVNWAWCHDINVQMHEIEELLGLPERAEVFLKSAREYEIVGYTSHRKFLSVTFTLKDDLLIIEDVILPRYETIRDIIIRQFLAASNESLDDW